MIKIKPKLASLDILNFAYTTWERLKEDISFYNYIKDNFETSHLEYFDEHSYSNTAYFVEFERTLSEWLPSHASESDFPSVNSSDILGVSKQINEAYQLSKLVEASKVADGQIKDRIDQPKHNHYFRPCPYDSVDVYRVLEIFNVTDPCLQHAVKKLLVAGGRGHKDIHKDIQDVIDTCTRWQTMRKEEGK